MHRDDRLIAISGANGFVGSALCEQLVAGGRPSRRIVRTSVGSKVARDPVRSHGDSVPQVDTFVLGDLATAAEERLAAALDGAFALVHTAARVHARQESSPEAVAAFHSSNVIATRRIARAAVRAGVQRMLLMSTIKVNGETTS